MMMLFSTDVGFALRRVRMCVLVSHGSLLDQVYESENHDPHDVDEVPVQRGEIDDERIARSKSATVVDREERQQPEHAGRHVGAVKSGEREERRAEEIGSDRETFVHERGELERLESEEGQAGDGCSPPSGRA